MGREEQDESGVAYSSSERAQLRYERPSNVPRHLKQPNQAATQQQNLTDSSPPVTTHHLEDLLEGVNREQQEDEVQEEIPEKIYKGQRLPQAHAYRNNYANDMSDGDETTQIPKHSQTGASALHQSRGHGKVH